MASDMNQPLILFLCTGNYYRSRFAEIWFNHRAEEYGCGWRAQSRGIAVDLGINNIGPLSPHTRKGLVERGIALPATLASPRQLQEVDLVSAQHVIAVKESEHRSLLVERFPGWDARVEYWEIDDIDCAHPDIALPQLENHLKQLLVRKQNR